jgi:glycosyltransferase 2 family protein
MNKKKLILGLRIAVSCAILTYLIDVLDWQRLYLVFSNLRLEYVWIAPILLLAGLYSLSVRWSLLLNYFGVRLSSKKSFIYYLVGNFYNIILPGSIGGDVVRVGICAVAQKKTVTLIASSVLLERVFGLLIVLFLGAIGIFFLSVELRQQLGATLSTSIIVLFSIGLFAFISVWILLRFIPLRSLESKFEKNKILATIINIFDRISQIPIQGLLGIIGFNLFSQIFDIIASYFLAKSILLDLPPIVFFVIIPIVYISTVLPISLGGLGVREGVLTLLLSRFNIISSDAVTFSFVLYLNRIFIASIGGIVQIFWRLPTKRTLTSENEEILEKGRSR